MRRIAFLIGTIALLIVCSAFAESWQTDIELISEADTLTVTIGRNTEALDGVDSMDVIMPIVPPSPPYAYLEIDDPANPYVDKLTVDIREDNADSVIWKAHLSSFSSPLYGEWNIAELPPGDFFVGAHYIGMEVTDWINMKSESSISFWPSQILDIVHIPDAFHPPDNPEITNWNPADGTSDVPVTTDISFDVTDEGSGIDPASISLEVNGEDVSSMISLASITNGYRVTYEPSTPLPGETWVSVIASASDNSSPANSVTDVIAFQTGYSIMPVLWETPITAFTTNTAGDDSTMKELSFGADLSATVGFDSGLDIVFPIAPPSIFYAYFPLDDPGYPFYNMLTRDIHDASLILDSWNVRFGNVDDVVGLKWDSDDLPADKDCYVASTFPPFYPETDDWQDMRTISDISFGPGRQAWIKVVSPSGDTATPRIAYTIPGDGETGVVVSTSISAAITDAESGVDSSSISLFVDGVDVSEDIVITISSDTTYVHYTPSTDFSPMTNVDCQLMVSDLADPPNTRDYEWDFTTGYFLTPVWMESLSVWTSEPGEPLRHFTLFFGADSSATDYFDYGLDQQMPPPVPGDVPYGFFTTPDSLWNQLTRDIRSSLDYEIIWSAMLNRISSIGGTTNWISWNSDGLPEDGSFDIAWLTAGDTVWQNMRIIDRIDITTSGNLLIRFTRGVPPTYCLAGTVQSASGAIEGAIVEIAGHNHDTSDASGYFEICDIPYSSEEWTILTSASGYSSDTFSMMIESDTTYNPYLEAASGTVSGVITCADDGSPEGAMIVLGDDTTYADELGNYSFEEVPFGEYVISASLLYYSTATRNIVVDELEETEDFELIRNMGNLGGTVTLADDPPVVAGTMVELVGTDIDPAYTNAEGYYVFVDIPYNMYDVRFSRMGYTTLDTTFELTQPEDTFDVTLERAGGELNPPRNLEGYGNYANRAVLNWDPPEPGAGTLLGYNVYRTVIFSDDTMVGFVEQPYTAFIEWNRTNYLPNTYYVTAVYDLGESEPTENVMVWVNPDSAYPDILIWDFDNGAMLANGGEMPEDDYLYSVLNLIDELEVVKTGQDQNINEEDLFQYRAIFMINGIDDENNSLPNNPSINNLATYIAAGGRVYCEGADFGYDYGSVMASGPRKRLFNLFGVGFASDGYPASSGNIENIRGEDTSFFTWGAVNLDYHFMTDADHRIDEWDEDTLIEGSTWAMFSQDSPPPVVSPLRMVYREYNNYRTVVSSAYIGAMIDRNEPSTRNHVITAIVNFLLDEEFQPPSLIEEKGTELPENMAIHAAPNPFNASCKLTLDIVEPGQVSLDIYDIDGRHVSNLANEFVSSGVYSVVWDGKSVESRKLPSGIYFAVLKSGGRQVKTRLVLIK